MEWGSFWCRLIEISMALGGNDASDEAVRYNYLGFQGKEDCSGLTWYWREFNESVNCMRREAA